MIQPAASATRITDTEHRQRVIVWCPQCRYLMDGGRCWRCSPGLATAATRPAPQYEPHPVGPGGIVYEPRGITFDVVSVNGVSVTPEKKEEDDDAEQEPAEQPGAP